MSANGAKNEGHLGQTIMPKILQDELIYIIQTSLNNIIRQATDLNKYAEDLCGELTKKIDRVSLKLKNLQNSVTQLTDVIHCRLLDKGASLKARKSKIAENTIIQTQHMHFPEKLPTKICDTHIGRVQTSNFIISTPPYYQDNMEGLKVSSDVLKCFEYCNDKVIPDRSEQKGRKLKQKNNHLDFFNDSENVPRSEMTKNISLGHIPIAFGETSNLCISQSVESSVFPVSFSENNKCLTSVGKVIPSPRQKPMYGVGDMKTPHTYVNYGTGMREELQPQPQTHLKTEVFVSPTAPNPPPPLPSNWLNLLRISNSTDNPPIIHSPTQLTSTVLKNSSVASSDCLKHSIDSGLPVTSSQVKFFPKQPKSFESYELIADDLYSRSEDQGIPPTLSTFTTFSPRIQSRTSASSGIDAPLDVQSTIPSVFQSVISSFGKSPKPFTKDLPRSPVSSKLRSALLPPPRLLNKPASKASVAPLPRTSSLQILHTSVPISVSSVQQTQTSSVSSSRCSEVKSSNISVAHLSRHLEAQSSRSSVAQAGHLIQPQQKKSSLNATKLSTQLPLHSSVCSPSPHSSSGTLSASQPSSPQLCSGLKTFPLSTLPTVNSDRKALMEAIRKGVLLRKTEHHCVPKANSEIEANPILTRRRAMGYNSGKSDSEADWMEER